MAIVYFCHRCDTKVECETKAGMICECGSYAKDHDMFLAISPSKQAIMLICVILGLELQKLNLLLPLWIKT